MEVYVNCRTLPFDQGVTVDGVLVTLHPENGGPALASGYTGSAGLGLVFLGDRAAGTYEVHVTPTVEYTVEAGNLQAIEVIEGDPQVFDVLLLLRNDVEQNAGENLCYCAGYFVDTYGRPFEGLTLRFSEERVPALLVSAENTVGVLPKALIVETDGNGFAAVTLLRGCQYNVYVEGLQHIVRTIKVPDLTYSNLPDVVFPSVFAVLYETLDRNDPEVTLQVGETVSLYVTTLYRSGLTEDGLEDVVLQYDDPSVATYDYDGSAYSIGITGVTAGTALLTPVSSTTEDGYGITIQPVPNPSIVGVLRVVVTA